MTPSSLVRHRSLACVLAACAAIAVPVAGACAQDDPAAAPGLLDKADDLGIGQGKTQWQTEGELGTLPATDEVIRGIEATLQRLSKAALAGDRKAYLAEIWGGDPWFMQEQRVWIATIPSAKLSAFRATVDSSAVTVTDAMASAPLTFQWTAAGKQHTLSFQGRFFRRSTRDGVRWDYAGEDWGRSRNTEKENIFAFEPQRDFARTVASSMRTVRRHVERGLQQPIDRVVVMRVYPSAEHLDFADGLGSLQGVAFDPARSTVKMLADDSLSEDPLRAHLTRIFARQAMAIMGSKPGAIPGWLAEGLVEFAAERFDDDASANEELVRTAALNNNLLDAGTLAKFESLPDTKRALAVEQGHHFLGYLAGRFDRAERTAFLKSLAAGTPIEQASADALGVDYPTLMSEWRTSLTETKAEPEAGEDTTGG